MLINGQDGVLTVGGTAAGAIEMVESQTKSELDALGPGQKQTITETTSLVKRGRSGKNIIPREAGWDEGWAWNDVQGAEGWWQTLMRGVWVDGSKVLKNQAVVIDVRILLPFFAKTETQTADLAIDQQPTHSRPTARCQSILRLNFWLKAAASSVL